MSSAFDQAVLIFEEVHFNLNYAIGLYYKSQLLQIQVFRLIYSPSTEFIMYSVKKSAQLLVFFVFETFATSLLRNLGLKVFVTFRS